MHHKKTFASVVLGLFVAILFVSNSAGAANLNQAANTLPQEDEWSVMARSSLGQISGQNFLRSPIIGGAATDYEKRILAITAIGENPRTFGAEDFVAKLEKFFDGNQIGEANLLNDDIFGILALHAVGISGNIISKSRQFILSHQNSDGGWGFATNTGSDSNTTAMAVAALSQVGSIPNSAFDYLNKAQDSTGGYGFIPGTAADGASTAWVIMGLNSTGKKSPANAISFLENLQNSNGSFKWKPNDENGSALVTAYAVIALSGHGLPIRNLPIALPSPTPVPNPTPNPNSSAVQLCIHINYEGGCESFAGNDADLRNNAVGNDNTSSIIVPVGNSVAVFEHINFLGSCEVFTANDADLRNNLIGNDSISSIRINATCPSPPVPMPAPTPLPTPSPLPKPLGLVHLTITYPGNKIFAGNVNFSQNKTVLQALTAAADQINLLYQIKQTGLGQFVSNINGYANSGIDGWQYAVNGIVPATGAADYVLHDQDRVQWFYGPANSLPY
ncbi:MAG: DUF4430 domain-containing protein [Candidatus Doudnabacteria bacterium]|nr:DUF4430 domain-containing protein [Candidatus Doudnabacteria bacterium]